MMSLVYGPAAVHFLSFPRVCETEFSHMGKNSGKPNLKLHENLLLYVNNKDIDQHAHLYSLISTFTGFLLAELNKIP